MPLLGPRPSFGPALAAISRCCATNGCDGHNRFGIPFWLVGEFTTRLRTYFSGDWDVHWGTTRDVDPWPDSNWVSSIPAAGCRRSERSLSVVRRAGDYTQALSFDTHVRQLFRVIPWNT